MSWKESKQREDFTVVLVHCVALEVNQISWCAPDQTKHWWIFLRSYPLTSNNTVLNGHGQVRLHRQILIGEQQIGDCTLTRVLVLPVTCILHV